MVDKKESFQDKFNRVMLPALAGVLVGGIFMAIMLLIILGGFQTSVAHPEPTAPICKCDCNMEG